VTPSFELRTLAPLLAFDLVDVYARDRRIGVARPRPIGDVTFELLGPAVGGTAFTPPLELAMTRNASGYHHFFGRYYPSDRAARLDLARRATQQGGAPDRLLPRLSLPVGEYRLRIVSGFYQQRELVVRLPSPDLRKPVTVELLPAYSYPFQGTSPLLLDPTSTVPCTQRARGTGPTLLRGGVHHPDGRGVDGAVVEVEGITRAYRTDVTGQWVLIFPETRDSGGVTVRIAQPAADGAPPTVVRIQHVCIVRGRETALAQTALRGWVQTRAGVPIRDARLRISGRPETPNRIDGSWFHYFDLDQAATEVTVTAAIGPPDDERTLTTSARVEPRSTVIVPTFRFP
jgi:hypothetical protein